MATFQMSNKLNSCESSYIALLENEDVITLIRLPTALEQLLPIGRALILGHSVYIMDGNVIDGRAGVRYNQNSFVTETSLPSEFFLRPTM